MTTMESIDATAPKRKRKPPSEWTKTEKLKRIKDMEPDFVGKAELARHLCCHINSIESYIRSGALPPSYTRLSDRHPLWLRKHYNVFKDTGKWPPAAYRSR